MAFSCVASSTNTQFLVLPAPRCLANLDIYLRQLDSSGIQNYDPDKANVLKTCFMDRTCSACSRPCDLISRLDEGNCPLTIDECILL